MTFEKAINNVVRASRTFTQGDVSTRIKRRNARRKLLGALLAAQNALNKHYPRIAKEKPIMPAVVKPKLAPFDTRSFDIPTVQLFMRIVCDVVNKKITPRLIAHEGSEFKQTAYHSTIYFKPGWPDRMKWRHIMFWQCSTVPEMRDLYYRFFREQIPVSDIQLAADHLAFLDKRRAKKP